MRLFLCMSFAFLIMATPAAAADPLLSGYAGPGGSDQVLLGSELTPASKGDRDLRAQAPAPVPAVTGDAAVPPVSSSRDAQATAPGAGASGASGRDDTAATPPSDRRRSADGRPSPQATTSVAAPRTESRTGSDADIGGLPLPARDLLLVAFALVGLVAVAVATSRAATPSPPGAA